ncbi:hypothetical protein VE02_06274 [Pseudogymnoascus sp. 03VT05]|nr:hypothetical protein VE02_06274 [Pseudogymnoascus sp. 03VT05]
MALTLPRRRTLFEDINKISVTANDAYILELMTELNELNEEATGFRWAAASTQIDQDRVLVNSEAFLLYVGHLKQGQSEGEKSDITFPADFKLLFLRIRLFVLYATPRMPGRARGTPCTYQSLTKIRSGLSFHANRSYRLRSMDAPRAAVLYSTITEVLRFAVTKYSIPLYGNPNTTHVGLSEIAQLIDLDMAQTRCFAVAEQHHLSWCIGRTCAVRPGSLGYNPKDKRRVPQGQFLTWRDVEIFRGTEAGHFTADIKFIVVKTNHQDAEAASKASKPSRSIRCRVMSPNLIDNLVFSVPHRILIIALRRKAIAGIDTLDELLNGEALNIQVCGRWKPSFLDQPILLGSTPRGLEVSDKPASSASLTEYLRERGKQMGYARTITFYSIRRRIATDLTEQVGPDHARRIMGHSAGSKTLEHYYLDDATITDLYAMALGESVNRQAMKETRLLHDLSTTALGAEEVRSIYGTILNEAVAAFIEQDPNAPETGSPREWRNYRRRVSQVVLTSLLRVRSEKLHETITREEATARVQRNASNSLMRAILQTCAAMPTQDPLDEEPPAMLADGGFESHYVESPPEPDIDLSPSSNVIMRFTDETSKPLDHMEVPDASVPYFTCVRLMMELLLIFSNSTPHVQAGGRLPLSTLPLSITARPRHNNQLVCNECHEDEEVDAEHRHRVWKCNAHLQRHLNSDFHSLRNKFLRRLEASHSPSSPWKCPICTQLQHPRAVEYPSSAKVLRHVEQSGQMVHLWGKEHEKLKTEAGYSSTWRHNTNGGVKASVRYERKKRAGGFAERMAVLESYGILYSEDAELAVSQPTPYEHVLSGGPAQLIDSMEVEGVTPIFEVPMNIDMDTADDFLKGCLRDDPSPPNLPSSLLQAMGLEPV